MDTEKAKEKYTINNIDEWDVVNEWASGKKNHPKYNVSYGQIVDDISDMDAFDDLYEEDEIDYYEKWKKRYNLKKWDKKEVVKLAKKLFQDSLDTAKKENAFEDYVAKENESSEKRKADIPENYYFVGNYPNSKYSYLFRHHYSGKEIKVTNYIIDPISYKMYYVSNKDSALKRHFTKKENNQ